MGERTDIAALFKAVKEGADDIKLAEEHGNAWARYYKAADRYRSALEDKEEREALALEFSHFVLRQWQREVLQALRDQGGRRITWVVDPAGSLGPFLPVD